ncbi:hypothetical protein GCM10009086_58360 [Pseudomonas rhodesiae]
MRSSNLSEVIGVVTQLVAGGQYIPSGELVTFVSVRQVGGNCSRPNPNPLRQCQHGTIILPSLDFGRCALQVNPFSTKAAFRGSDHGFDEAQYNEALLKSAGT